VLLFFGTLKNRAEEEEEAAENEIRLSFKIGSVKVAPCRTCFMM
jgi:hypothetical protein